MGSSKARMLPRPPASNGAFVTVKPFATGHMITPAATLVADALGRSMATSWRFLIRHEPTGTNLWFDMGISHDTSIYPPSIQALHKHFNLMPSLTTLEEDTLSASIPPSLISHFIVSHAHWDHIFPISSSFPNANMVVGPGSIKHCTPSYPTDPKSKYDGRIWDPKLREFDLKELPSPDTAEEGFWTSLGPFQNAHDFFGDGSLYLVEARGHMVGNIAAILRVRTKSKSLDNETSDSDESDDGEENWKWVILGGDCAPCNIFTYWPETPFGKMPQELFPSGTLHECTKGARDVISRIAECKRNEGEKVLVWYAHGEFLEGVWDVS